MTPRRWLILLIFYVSYLFLGASIYYHIENRLEREQREIALRERIEINEFLAEQLKDQDESIQVEVLEKITDYCGKPVTNYTLDEFEEPYRWSFYHSLFFAFTVCSTVGYGNLAPTTTLGQMIMIIYSLVGIPINGILLVGLGEYFSRTFSGIYRRYKKYKMANDDKYVPKQFGLFATVMIALVPGVTIFILLPSLLFSYFEGWPYTLSIYYSYVTTTTIGFGDYVPTFKPDQERIFGIEFLFYQIFIIVWFIFSLGYLVMIMTYITRGLQSKKLSQLEHQLSLNIKATQHRIWHGVTKDVGYLRRILNELYIMKFKPVYNEPGEKFLTSLPRSASCPDLMMYRDDAPIISRKRAFSENFDAQEVKEQLALGTPQYNTLYRVSSDTDLEKINKEKTFETAKAFMETTDLLAKVVTALANISPPKDDIPGGYHGFSDAEILASENMQGWSYPFGDNPPYPIYQRPRALSDFFLSPRTQIPASNNEWTWSGDNDQIQRVINKRVKYSPEKKDDLYKFSFGSPPTSDRAIIINMEGGEPRNSNMDTVTSNKSTSFFKRFNPFTRKKSTSSILDAASEKTYDPAYASAINYRTVTGGQTPNYPPLQDIDSLFTTNTRHKHSSYSETEKYPYLPNNVDTARNLPNRRSSLFTTGYDARDSNYNEDRRGSYLNPKDFSRGSRRNVLDAPTSRGSSDRRGSLFVPGPASNRRGSLWAPTGVGGKRRSSAQSTSTYNRRGSLFSVPSQEAVDQEILETTTIADLIRAIEVIHTRDALQNIPSDIDEPKRKMGTASLTPPKLPSLLTLFSSNNNDNNNNINNSNEQNNIPNISSRRNTMFGDLFSSSRRPSVLSSSARRRSSLKPQSAAVPSQLPPPYTEKESPKFKRRFSVRPTNLSIPPGQAPLPSSTNIQKSQIPGQIQSQTALQRRLSLRPSPLARELNASGDSSNTSGTSTSNSSTSGVFTRQVPGQGSTARGTIPSSSSTFSPLYRIAQMQASRKSSLPETSQPDIKK